LVPAEFAAMAETQDFSYTVIASGDYQVAEEAASLAKIVEQHLPFHREEMPEPLRFKSEPRAAWGALLALGVTFFVGQHLARKFLDEVYTVILQPRIKPFLEKLDQKLNGGNHKARKMFTVSVWYEDYDTLVAVSVAGNSFDEMLQQLALVPTVHANALSWLATNERSKPVHYYKIEDGKVNAEPLLLDRFIDVLR
jgi:hypothetical protein